MKTLIDRDRQRVLEAETDTGRFRLVGECNICGRCCELHRADCKHLLSETWDGIPVRPCAIYPDRPWYCSFYPYDPESSDDPPEGCGLAWELIVDD